MKWVSSADWNTRVLPALSAFNVRKVVLANKGLMRILRTRVLLLVKTSALVASKKPLTMTATYCDLLFHSSWHSTLLQKNRKRLLPDLIWHVCFELRPQSSVLGFCLIGLIQLAVPPAPHTTSNMYLFNWGISSCLSRTGFSMLKRPRKIKQKIRTIWGGVALWQQGLASKCKQMWVCGTALMFWVSGDWEHKAVCNLLVTSCLWLLKPYTDFSKGSPVQCKQNTTITDPKHGASVESNGWHLRVVLLNWECASLPRRIRHVCSFGLLIADWQNVRLS